MGAARPPDGSTGPRVHGQPRCRQHQETDGRGNRLPSLTRRCDTKSPAAPRRFDATQTTGMFLQCESQSYMSAICRR